ncbi:hypothetical protein P8C59_007557 [Phyllachora maydis]|uniref:Uncharacterized protein n=1 Tax=Phyllachora maydis TaxID=1825666 RepID=A0AAD9I8Q8_9PEZI|nr:hypothetical protein P8C59_007557 [Phyllachora maydis]
MDVNRSPHTPSKATGAEMSKLGSNRSRANTAAADSPGLRASKHASKSLQRATIVTDHLNNLDERDTKGVEYADSSIKELLKANSMRLEEINHKIEVTDIRNAARHTVLYNGVKDTFVLLKKIHQQLQVNDEPSNPEEILKKNQGNFEFALQQYMDALNESTTKEEAQQAAALCVQYSSNLFKHHLHF